MSRWSGVRALLSASRSLYTVFHIRCPHYLPLVFFFLRSPTLCSLFLIFLFFLLAFVDSSLRALSRRLFPRIQWPCTFYDVVITATVSGFSRPPSSKVLYCISLSSTDYSRERKWGKSDKCLRQRRPYDGDLTEAVETQQVIKLLITRATRTPVDVCWDHSKRDDRLANLRADYN